MKKILAGLVGVTLIGATALATTTSAEARWGGWGGWGWGVGGFAARSHRYCSDGSILRICLRAGLRLCTRLHLRLRPGLSRLLDRTPFRPDR